MVIDGLLSISPSYTITSVDITGMIKKEIIIHRILINTIIGSIKMTKNGGLEVFCIISTDQPYAAGFKFLGSADLSGTLNITVAGVGEYPPINKPYVIFFLVLSNERQID